MKKASAFLLMVCLFAAVCTAAISEYEGSHAIYNDCSLIGAKTDILTDADNAAEKYIRQVFGLRREPERLRTVPLSGNNSTVFSALTDLAQEVAAGNRQSTVCEIPLRSLLSKLSYTAQDLNVSSLMNGGNLSEEAENRFITAVEADLALDLPLVFSALKATVPFDLYWFGNGYDYGFPGYWFNDETIFFEETDCYTINLYVSANYSLTGNEETTDYNTAYGQRIRAAAANAHSIVSANAGKSDFGKLYSYKNAICDAVSYNTAAAAGGYPYGDPWQAVFVFDNDPETNVVCEGYSKAFKYLCDLSAFSSSVTASTVTGVMSGGTGAGPHMWNLVNINGTRYLVDVTNCDEGSVGAPDELFMAGYSSSYTEGNKWGYIYQAGGSSIKYVYDTETTGLYSVEELTASAEDYNPGNEICCIEEGVPVEHDWGEATYQWADDNSTVTATRICTRNASHIETETAYTSSEMTREATCTVKGETTYTAVFSNPAFSIAPKTLEDIPKLNHNMTEYPVVPATCTTDGNIQYWYCSGCGKYFRDAEAADEITAAATVVAATGHDDPLAHTDAKPATCTDAGNIEYWYCSGCGKYFRDAEATDEVIASATVIPSSHTLTHHENKPATCTAAGNTEYWTCDVCGQFFSDNQGSESIPEEDTVIAATGHKWGEPLYKWSTDNQWVTATRTCEHDQSHLEIEEAEGIITSQIPPTCRNDGKVIRTATFDNPVFTTQVKEIRVPKLQHEWSIHQDAVEAACTAAGNSEYWYCSSCKKYFSDAEGMTEIEENSWIIPAAGHTMTAIAAKAAACTETGNSAYWKCTACNKYFSDAEGLEEIEENSWIIPAAGHTEVVDAAVTATCTETGLTEGKHCSACNKVLVAQEVVPAKGHTEVADAAVAATCTETGLTEGKHCSVCHEVLVAQKVEPAKGHTEVTDAAVAATCTEAGLTEGRHCSVCHEVFVAQEVVPAKGHTLIKHDQVEPTYTTTGTEEYWSCGVCGKRFADESAEKQIDEPAAIQVVDHDHTLSLTAHTKVDATCEKNGTEAYWECALCGKMFSDEKGTAEISAPVMIAAPGHHEVTDATVAATCTETGLTEGKHCDRCNTVLIAQETVATLGHHEVTDAAVAATCTETGLTEGKHCDRCNTVLVAQETVAALGHHEVTDAPVSATCTETGLTEGKHCDHCNTVLVAQETVAALGHHEVTDAAVAATCTETGLTEGKHCDRCNTILVAQETVAATGHSWGEATYTWSNDNSQVTAKRVCENDASHTETETVSATYKVKKDATTKKTGTGVYTSEAFTNPAFTQQTKEVTIAKYPTTYKDKSCKYKIRDNLTAVVAGPAKKTVTTITIPDTITVKGKKMKVVGINANAFKGNKKIKTVKIGKNVSSIGKNAFYNCTKLAKITGMAGVTTIGDGAFQKCTSLTAITLPSKVKKIGKNAFNGDKKLKTITIKTTKLTEKNVGANAFKGIYSKATVKCPKSKLKAYKKFLMKKGVPKKAKITK